jgi:hypothetical protein
MTPAAKRRFQILVIIAGVHIIAVMLYFALAPRPDHSSKYGNSLGDGVVGGLIFPLFALLDDTVLPLLPNSYAIAIVVFALNSLLWATIVLGLTYLCRSVFAVFRPQKSM